MQIHEWLNIYVCILNILYQTLNNKVTKSHGNVKDIQCEVRKQNVLFYQLKETWPLIFWIRIQSYKAEVTTFERVLTTPHFVGLRARGAKVWNHYQYNKECIAECLGFKSQR